MTDNEGREIAGYDTQTGEPIYRDEKQPETSFAGNESEVNFTMKAPEPEPQPEAQAQPQPQPQPQPMPSDNVYRYQNAAAVKPVKKKEKKGWTMPKIAIAAAMFGVIAAGCFFGVNAGIRLLTGEKGPQTPPEQIGQTQIQANTDNSKATGSAATDVSGIVEGVMPSVVGITEKQTVQSYFGQQYQAESAGSGFIVKQDGDELLVVTNGHVVEKAEEINVIFCDNKVAKAKVKGVSSTNDIAVLTVDMKDIEDSTKKQIKAATLRETDDVKVGEMAIAIGNANGSGQSVTVGYVSAKDRTFVVGGTNADGKPNTRPMLQTDAAINPGNSGGPLIDSKGRVIGITTSKEFQTTDGRDIVGMSYAIPMTDGVSIINDLMNREVLKDEEKGYLGITGQSVDAASAKQYNMPEGVYVTGISDTGAAYKAGILQGDVITKIDGRDVKQVSDIQEIVNSKRVGTTIEVTLKRNNGKEYEEKVIKVKLASKDTLDGLSEDDKKDEKEEKDDNPYQDPTDQYDNQGDGFGDGFGDGSQIIPWGFGN